MKPTLTISTLLLLQPTSPSAQDTGHGAIKALSTTSKEASEPTIVWVTSTHTDGEITFVASFYTQQFGSMYESVATPLSGSIGLGTQTGTVGAARQVPALGTGMRVRGEWDSWMVRLGVVVGGVLAGAVLVGGMVL